ncbi:hypothetical protein [Tenggerimyces flavus]|uniref:Uncharacterized protein n=1 Tax=Tenggerimyces flavus TaxID=1708749 RepID=A0ABV7YCF7_9ACTN|nr:hypothetical protein [Tenggerimyces flavus]MBM7783426.1 hypothetical protein [Tenggerimyces flavus]
MHETDLHLEPNEASDLSRVFSQPTLDRHGWDRAFVTVLDEAAAEDALALLVHTKGAALDDGWQAIRVHADPEPPEDRGRTEDAEACARRDGTIYILGSQFGKKAGPLSAKRSWIARVSEEELEHAATAGRTKLEIARRRFGIHRAVNDAIASLDLIPLGAGAKQAYVDATIAKANARPNAGTADSAPRTTRSTSRPPSSAPTATCCSVSAIPSRPTATRSSSSCTTSTPSSPTRTPPRPTATSGSSPTSAAGKRPPVSADSTAPATTRSRP